MRRCLFFLLIMTYYVCVITAWSEEVASIEGTLLMLDGKTPHVSVPVQAIRGGEVVATALSDGNGNYRLTGLKPGQYRVRCQIFGGYVYYRNSRGERSLLVSSRSITEGDVLEVAPDSSFSNIDFHFPPFKKGTWQNYDTLDGLAYNIVTDIRRDLHGMMWFATKGSGVSRYDGGKFANFTTKDGLAHNDVFSIYVDPDGTVWFGTHGGVSRYDGKEFQNFTKEDGLTGNVIHAIHSVPDGAMWFGAWDGVSAYDQGEFTNITTEDGLSHNNVTAIHRDPDGGMWFGTDGRGVSWYDGTAWTSLDTRDGLAGETVSSIYQDPEGLLWFGTEGGVTRYHRNTTPPKASIVSVTTDRTYTDLSAIPAFTTRTRITIEYDSIDLKTVPGKRQYRCRIREVDPDWREPSKALTFDHTFREAGTYTIDVY